MRGKPITFDGKRISQIAAEVNLNIGVLRGRLSRDPDITYENLVRPIDLGSGRRTHGCSKSHTRLYGIWRAMRRRCTDSHADRYERYGGRGIKVCDEWQHDPLAFCQWAMANGYQDGLQIDRINNDGNYEPSNCRWVTVRENCHNTYVNVNLTIKGETKCMREWAEVIGTNHGTISNWIRWKGLPYAVKRLSEAIENGYSKKKRVRRNYLTVHGQKKDVGEWSRETGIGRTAINVWIRKNGEDFAKTKIEEALEQSPLTKERHIEHEQIIQN